MKKKRRGIIILEEEVNVVPLMDILTTMLFFLIVIASLNKYTSVIAKTENYNPSTSKEKPHFELALVLRSPTTLDLFVGKIDDLDMQYPDEIKSYLRSKFTKKNRVGYSKRFWISKKRSLETASENIITHLQVIKKSFPNEKKISLIVSDNFKYQDMLVLIESISETKDGQELFPQVSLQEMAHEDDKG